MIKFQLVPKGTKPPYIEVEKGMATACYDDLSIYVNSEPVDTLSNQIIVYDSNGSIISFSVKNREEAIKTSKFNYDIGEPFISISSSSMDDLRRFMINGIKKYDNITKSIQENSLIGMDIDELIHIFKINNVKKIKKVGKSKSGLSNEQAQKGVKQFTYASIISSAVSLVVFWWLAMVGIFFGVRGLMLTWHKGNADDKNLIFYRIISISGIVIGFVSWYLYSTSR